MATESEEMLAYIGIYVIFLDYGATEVQIKDMWTDISSHKPKTNFNEIK